MKRKELNKLLRKLDPKDELDIFVADFGEEG